MHTSKMSNFSAKEQLSILKTVGEVIRTIRVPFWKPLARPSISENRIFSLENPVKKHNMPIVYQDDPCNARVVRYVMCIVR